MDAIERRERYVEMFDRQLDRLGISLTTEQQEKVVDETIAFRTKVRDAGRDAAGRSQDERRAAMDALREEYSQTVYSLVPTGDAEKIVESMGRYPGYGFRQRDAGGRGGGPAVADGPPTTGTETGGTHRSLGVPARGAVLYCPTRAHVYGRSFAMRIGVPTEIKTLEGRVAIVPGGVSALVADGHEVLVQRGAGLGSGITDEEFAAGRREAPRHGGGGLDLGRDDREGEGAAPGGVRLLPQRSDDLHVLPLRGRARS